LFSFFQEEILDLLEKLSKTAKGGCEAVDVSKIKSKSSQKTGMLSYLTWGYLGSSGSIPVAN
jgi:hypothetical protein